MTKIDELSELLLETWRRSDPDDTGVHEAGLIYALAEVTRANALGVNVPADVYVWWVASHLSDRITELSVEAA